MVFNKEIRFIELHNVNMPLCKFFKQLIDFFIVYG